MTPLLRVAALLSALVLQTLPAAAASLSTLPATPILTGEADYFIDLGDAANDGFGEAIGEVSDGVDAFEFSITGAFDGGTMGDNATADLLISPIPGFVPTFISGVLAEFEIGAGFLALLFDLDAGNTGNALFGTQALVILRDSAFPALDGVAEVEVLRLDTAVIPLPAAAPLLVSGVAALALLRRRRRV